MKKSTLPNWVPTVVNQNISTPEPLKRNFRESAYIVNQIGILITYNVLLSTVNFDGVIDTITPTHPKSHACLHPLIRVI